MIHYHKWSVPVVCDLSPSGVSRLNRLRRREEEENRKGKCSERYNRAIRELMWHNADSLNYMNEREFK